MERKDTEDLATRYTIHTPTKGVDWVNVEELYRLSAILTNARKKSSHEPTFSLVMMGCGNHFCTPGK